MINLKTLSLPRIERWKDSVKTKQMTSQHRSSLNLIFLIIINLKGLNKIVLIRRHKGLVPLYFVLLVLKTLVFWKFKGY